MSRPGAFYGRFLNTPRKVLAEVYQDGGKFGFTLRHISDIYEDGYYEFCSGHHMESFEDCEAEIDHQETILLQGSLIPVGGFNALKED